MQKSKFTIAVTAILCLCPVASFAAKTVKICKTNVQISNVKTVETSSETNISREQSELEDQGYVVRRCKVNLSSRNIRGTALVLRSQESDDEGEVSAIVYQD